VLRAAIEEIAEVGWSGFQVESVAARAGVHKTTVYRRWPSPGALLAAAMEATPLRGVVGGEVPDTGSLRGDLERLLDDAIDVWARPEPRRAARQLFAARHHPDVRAAFDRYWEMELSRVETIVRRAADRGDVPGDVDPRFVAEVFHGTMLLRLVELDQEITYEGTRQLLEGVLRIAGHHAR
jgi:AcrR family transcriptional regulator